MKDNYQLFPKKHIQPYDGMSITANVWGEAHGYHAQMQNAHQYFLHGSGIVVGLEVVASDPPDSVIFILPGAAIDTAGRMIVLAEPVAYDLGSKIEGKLRLLMMHREVKAKSEQSEENNAPAFMQDEFVIIARAEPLDTPYVELARMERSDAKAAITDAKDPLAPQVNSIDLRFRTHVCPPPVQQIMAGVCYLDNTPETFFAQALNNLTQPMAHLTPYQVIVENKVPLDDKIFNFQMLYLVSPAGGKLDKKQVELLQNYLQNGGKVLLEFCEPVEDEGVTALLKPVGIKVSQIPVESSLFQSPHLFVAPPRGPVAKDKTGLWYGAPGVIAISGGYGSLWSGKARQADITRSVIRDSVEWGINLLNFLLSS